MAQSRNVSKIFGGLEVLNFVDSNNQRLLHVATPLDSTDGVNKAYVDSMINNGSLNFQNGLTLIGNTVTLDNNLPHVTGIGTLINGTWTADTISVNYGGTGTTQFASNKLIMGNGTNPLQTVNDISLNNNIFNASIPILFSNTSNAINTTSGGCLTVNGGASIAKNVIIGGDLTAYNATIQNLAIPGVTIFSNIQSFASSFNNLSVSNLLCTNSTLNNIVLSSLTTTSGTLFNSTLSNTLINNGTINNLNITYSTISNLRFTNASGSNLIITNFTGNNTIISNSTIQSSFISNCTATNLSISTATGNNIYINNHSVANSCINYLTSGSSYLTTSTINNLYLNNGSIANMIISNITCSNVNANISNINYLTCGSSYLQNISSNNANINTTYITNGNILNTYITNANINTTYITNGNILNTYITNANINTTYITNGNILNSYITNGNIYTSFITNGNIINSYITNGNTYNSSISNLYNSFGTISNLIINTSCTANNLYINNTSINSLNINNGTVNSLYLSNEICQNSSITNLRSLNITSSNITSLNIYTPNSLHLIATITTANIYNGIATNLTISNLNISNTATFQKQINLGYNLTAPGNTSLLNINNYTFTDNTSNLTNSRWASTFFATPTLSAVSNITTTKAANVYIQGKPLAGSNQTITYSSNLALGYNPVVTGGNLSGQIMFERFDGNWFTSMYVDNSNQFVINNASVDSGVTSGTAGIGLYVYQNNPITFASIPNVSNIIPTAFIKFSNTISTFYSTTESINLSTASLVLNGGISINKSLTTPNGSISNLVNTNLTCANLNANNSIINNITCTNNVLNHITANNLYLNNGNINNITGSNLNMNNGLFNNITINNLNISNIVIDTITNTNLISNNITGTNLKLTNGIIDTITNTNFMSNNITGTNLKLTNGIIDNITGTNLKLTNGIIDTITNTNFMSNNITGTNLKLTNGIIDNITGTNLHITTISSGNIYSGAGILGPTFLLQNNYVDVTVGTFNINSNFTSSNTVLFIEPGNPGIYGAIGNDNGFGTGILTNTSNDSIQWNYARLIIRGVSLNTYTTGSSITLQPFILEGISGIMNTQNNFNVVDSGSDYGYSTWISPWFSTNNVNKLQSLGIQVLYITNGNMLTGNVRIGPTYLQFKS